MRVTYRSKDVKSYWEDRWSSIDADAPMENVGAYPLRYANLIIQSNDGPILEAGCGAGRIVRYYHNLGFTVTGFDYVDTAISKLKSADPTLDVDIGDIRNLKYPDQAFRYILAFGLYHNLETGLSDAINETFRVLKGGGWVCSSFRADNIQTRLVDWLAHMRAKRTSQHYSVRAFHKLNLTKSEYATLFRNAGFDVQAIMPVENMPILYKFSFFRARSHKIFDESIGRKEGYKLSRLGGLLQSFLMYLFPDQFCNIYVMIAKRPESKC